MEAFKTLGLSEPIIQAIKEKKFSEPTEIQQKTIPLVLKGQDVIAGSATGSGKTLAFGSAIIDKTTHGAGVQALVLTPTRELAEQVAKELAYFSKHKKLAILPVYGGVGINPQIDKLPKTDVVVGTPGRILDHMSRRTIDLKGVKVLVLDEADRMFDMGFIDDVTRIIKACPRKRQTLLFSATITPDVSRLSKNYMDDPVKVSAQALVDSTKLHQVYYNVRDNEKLSLLVHLLKHEDAKLVMVFSNTQQNTDFVTRTLRANGIKAMALHGGHSQQKRNMVMEKFHTEELQVLVCTDVAARGLDIKDVTHVYNYDIPKDAKQYVHRIGRTARAGSAGIAVNILGPRDHPNFQRVLDERTGKIERRETPHLERIKVAARQSSPPRGRGGYGRGPGRGSGHGRGGFGQRRRHW